MTEGLIHCPECNSDNLVNSVYCCQCGSPMRKGIPAKIRKTSWISVIVFALILSCILTLSIQLIRSRQTTPPTTEQHSQVTQSIAPEQPQAIEPGLQPASSDKPSLVSRIFSDDNQPATLEDLLVGNVSIINPDGLAISKFPAVVVSGSWLALPTRACIGGDKWLVKVGNDAAVPIEGGLWGRGDAVGFWQMAGEKKFKGPDFSTWQQGAPVRHFSTKTGLLSEPMTLDPSGVEGAFIYSSLVKPLDPGVFLQNGKVVGWSFGELLDGAYMWALGQNSNLLYENYVDDFYNETFAGGREEYFSLALSKAGVFSPQRQLQMFSEGFWVRPKLSPKDTPKNLSPETIYPYISKLVNHIMNQGAYQYIVTLADEPLLKEVKDAELLINVAQATEKIYGTNAAITFIEGTGAEIQQTMDGGNDELKEFHLKLYLGWIRSLLDNGNTARAWQVYNHAQPLFSDSPQLHLLAVELALAGGDWEEAEGLLGQREYPSENRETRMLLADRISDLKGQENKLVIKFQAGSRVIPVNATVNEQLGHDFLVDTGASFVTIPYSTVEALGLEDELSPHQLEVQTAGGQLSAYAVTLESIELQGWAVPNVKALVMDLPNRPGLGLLGLNFLNSFRMDLQSDKGLLTLEPK